MKRLGLILAAGLFFAGCEDATRPDAVAVSPDVTPTGASGGYEMIDLGTLGGTWSVAIAINNRGQVAGQSETATGEVKFFLWENGVMTDLGPPGGADPRAENWTRAINARGQVIGRYETGPDKRAFVWDNGVWTDLGPPGESSQAVAINDRGQVVGSGGQTGAFLWENGVLTDLGTLEWAADINARGQVVGWNWSPSEQHAFLWENGVMTDLGHLGGNRSEAVAINNRGQVVGNSETATGEKRPFLWENGVMTDLGAPSVPSGAKDINERGQVIGDSVPGQPGRAFLWENGVTTDLGSLGGIWVSAWDINERGQVTGVSATGTGDDFHAFVWADAVMTDLGPPGNPSAALAINERGQMVGLIFTGPGECGVYSESQRCRATLWTPKN